MKFRKLLLATTIAISSLSVNAELITTDWQTDNDNAAMLDTISGITWLQLNHTTASMQTMLNKMTTGGTLEGWSFANRDQIDSLWDNGHANVYSQMNKVNNYYVAARWYRENTNDIGFIGSRQAAQFYDRVGYDTANAYGWWIVKGAGSTLSETSSKYVLPENYVPATNASASVPISASFGLLALGLAGLSFRRKNK